MKSQSYEEFVEKFKPKKTTDDCYTPAPIYDAVSNWVANEYNLDKSKFCRPFYPGGDYENYDYSGKIVVDNPPFSILAKILDFYDKNGIKCFLFAPTLTVLSNKKSLDFTAIPCGADLTYENGAVVNTSFVTNLDNKEIQIRTAPRLYEAIKKANEENIRQTKKELPKYSYPDNLITAARIYPLAKYGIEFKVLKSQCKHIRALDSQRKVKKAIFGAGFLVSDDVKAELQKAELEKAKLEKAKLEKANRWELSDYEKQIIQNLNSAKGR